MSAGFSVTPKDKLPVGKYSEDLVLYVYNEVADIMTLADEDPNMIPIKTISLNFEVIPEQVLIKLEAKPTNGGTLSGAGSYDLGSEVVVEAKAKPGYEFVRWLEDGEELSKKSKLNFVAKDARYLVAEFEAKKDEVPETGDSSKIGLYTTMSVATLSLATTLYLYKKKKYNE